MRIVFLVLEAVAIVALLLIAVTQLLIPAFRGTAYFPFFTRSRERELREKIVEEQQLAREDDLESVLEHLQSFTHTTNHKENQL